MAKNIFDLLIFNVLTGLLACAPSPTSRQPLVKFNGTPREIKLMTLDPGHFHAALIQKFAYEQVDTNVHVYAPGGAELEGHLARIRGFNQRGENPTHWTSHLHAGPDFLAKMIAEKPGNVVIVSGNNAQKARYIQTCIEAGLNVLADKPMAIKPADFDSLRITFDKAAKKGVLLYDIMTERYEVTSILQKRLSQAPELFGTLEKGTAENPAITKESVHHFFKFVSGQPLIRPAWFFDVEQEGEGIVDVSTHLVDLVFWACFPEQIIDYEKNIRLLKAKRWATVLAPAQFGRVTGLPDYPAYLKKDVVKDSLLQIYSNGEIVFEVNGVVAKVSVAWNYQAPEGAGDTHASVMRGTKANLVIRQGKEQGYRPVLYVEPINAKGTAIDEKVLKQVLSSLGNEYPGLRCEPNGKAWKIAVPDQYNVGHEAHFAQVAEKYMQYLKDGKLPAWEVPNMLAKYYVTTTAYQKSR